MLLSLSETSSSSRFVFWQKSDSRQDGRLCMQVGEAEPFICELLRGLATTILDLQPHQIHMFYESVSKEVQPLLTASPGTIRVCKGGF